ncbi:toxin glutamine deamidase domain-containing protein [Streptomyces werraensis]|uniref:Toxin glutamine deamidase domain-containing protein n=1 Tax=Streptomyces werraensis TaxID=68284 RepID=A0ABV3J954_9ACTN
MPVHYDDAHIRELGNQWITTGQQLHEHLEVMHGSVQAMSGGWTGKAGHAAQLVWNGVADHNIWHALWEAGWVAQEIGKAVLNYADELQKTIREINRAHLIEALTTIFGMVLAVASFGITGILGRLVSLVDRLVQSIASSISRIAAATGAIGRAAAFTADSVLNAAVTLGTDVLAQWMGSQAGNGPMHIDWQSEGLNMGLGVWTGWGTGGIDVFKGPNTAAAGQGLPNVSVPTPTPAPHNASNVTVPQMAGTPNAGLPHAGDLAQFPVNSVVETNHVPPTGAGVTGPVTAAPGPNAGRPGNVTALPGNVRAVQSRTGAEAPGTPRPDAPVPHPLPNTSLGQAVDGAGRPPAAVRPGEVAPEGTTPATTGPKTTVTPEAGAPVRDTSGNQVTTGGGAQPPNVVRTDANTTSGTRPQAFLEGPPRSAAASDARTETPPSTATPRGDGGGAGESVAVGPGTPPRTGVTGEGIPVATTTSHEPGAGGTVPPNTLTSHSGGPQAGPLADGRAGAGANAARDTTSTPHGTPAASESVRGTQIPTRGTGTPEPTPVRPDAHPGVTGGRGAADTPTGGVRPNGPEPAGGRVAHDGPQTAGGGGSRRPAHQVGGTTETDGTTGRTSTNAGTSDAPGRAVEPTASSASEAPAVTHHDAGSGTTTHDGAHATSPGGGRPVEPGHEAGPAPVRSGGAADGGPGHPTPHGPAPRDGVHAEQQWHVYRQEQYERSVPVVEAEARLDHRQQELDASWNEAYGTFVDNNVFGASYLARDGHQVRNAHWQWRNDITQEFRAETGRAGHVSSEAFDAIVHNAKENAYKYIVRADQKERFAAGFREQVDAYKANRFGDGDTLPQFEQAPGRYVFDRDLNRFVKDDGKLYGHPGGGEPRPVGRSGDGADGSGPDDVTVGDRTSDAGAPGDHFRDKSHDFNVLEQYYITKEVELDGILDRFLHDEGTGGGLPARTGREIDALLDGVLEDLGAIAARERDIRTATDEQFDDIVRWHSRDADGLSEDFVAKVRQDFQHALRAEHDLIFRHGDGDGPRALWELTTTRAIDELPGRIAREHFVRARLAEETAYAQSQLSQLGEDFLTQFGEGGRQRVVGEYLDTVRTLAERHFTERLDNPVKPGESAPQWTGVRDDLRASLPDRIRHEGDLQAVVGEGAHAFHEILGHPGSTEAFQLHEDTVSRLGDDFRRERVTKYDELFAPEGHKTSAWLSHESRHEDGFQVRLDELRDGEYSPELRSWGHPAFRDWRAGRATPVEGLMAARPDIPQRLSAPERHTAATVDNAGAETPAVPPTRSQAETGMQPQTETDHAPQPHREGQATQMQVTVERDAAGFPGTAVRTPDAAVHAQESATVQRPAERDQGQAQTLRQNDTRTTDVVREVHRIMGRSTAYTQTRGQVEFAHQELLEARRETAALPVTTQAVLVASALTRSHGQMMKAANDTLARYTGVFPDHRRIHQVHQELFEQFGTEFQQLTPAQRADIVVARTLDERFGRAAGPQHELAEAVDPAQMEEATRGVPAERDLDDEPVRQLDQDHLDLLGTDALSPRSLLAERAAVPVDFVTGGQRLADAVNDALGTRTDRQVSYGDVDGVVRQPAAEAGEERTSLPGPGQVEADAGHILGTTHPESAETPVADTVDKGKGVHHGQAARLQESADEHVDHTDLDEVLHELQSEEPMLHSLTPDELRDAFRIQEYTDPAVPGRAQQTRLHDLGRIGRELHEHGPEAAWDLAGRLSGNGDRAGLFAGSSHETAAASSASRSAGAADTSQPSAPVEYTVPEAHLTADPKSFLETYVLSMDMNRGLEIHAEGLDAAARDAFLRALDILPGHEGHLPEHRFVLAQRGVDTSGKPVLALTPAVEWYAARYGAERFAFHEDTFLPDVRADSDYVNAVFVPYFTRGAEDYANTVGHAGVLRHPGQSDPRLVVTPTMNGCAYAVTSHADPGRMTVWHYQSPDSKMPAPVQFRREQRPTDWYGAGEYSGAVPEGRLFEVANLMWYGKDGWEFISQENHTGAKDPDVVTLADVHGRPVHVRSGHEVEYTATAYQSLIHSELHDWELPQALRNIEGVLPEGPDTPVLRELHDRIARHIEGEIDRLGTVADFDELRGLADTFKAERAAMKADLEATVARAAAAAVDWATREATEAAVMARRNHAEAMVDHFVNRPGKDWIDLLRSEAAPEDPRTTAALYQGKARTELASGQSTVNIVFQDILRANPQGRVAQAVQAVMEQVRAEIGSEIRQLGRAEDFNGLSGLARRFQEQREAVRLTGRAQFEALTHGVKDRKQVGQFRTLVDALLNALVSPRLEDWIGDLRQETTALAGASAWHRLPRAEQEELGRRIRDLLPEGSRQEAFFDLRVQDTYDGLDESVRARPLSDRARVVADSLYGGPRIDDIDDIFVHSVNSRLTELGRNQVSPWRVHQAYQRLESLRGAAFSRSNRVFREEALARHLAGLSGATRPGGALSTSAESQSVRVDDTAVGKAKAVDRGRTGRRAEFVQGSSSGRLLEPDEQPPTLDDALREAYEDEPLLHEMPFDEVREAFRLQQSGNPWVPGQRQRERLQELARIGRELHERGPEAAQALADRLAQDANRADATSVASTLQEPGASAAEAVGEKFHAPVTVWRYDRTVRTHSHTGQQGSGLWRDVRNPARTATSEELGIAPGAMEHGDQFDEVTDRVFSSGNVTISTLGEIAKPDQWTNTVRRVLPDAKRRIELALRELRAVDGAPQGALLDVLRSSFPLFQQVPPSEAVSLLAHVADVLGRVRSGLDSDTAAITLVGKTSYHVGAALAKKAGAVAWVDPTARDVIDRLTDPGRKKRDEIAAIFERKGPIHLTKANEEDWDLAWTIVHEATHRYSGTDDYQYSSYEMEKVEDAIGAPRTENRQARDPGTYTGQDETTLPVKQYNWYAMGKRSLMNADSFAQFVMTLTGERNAGLGELYAGPAVSRTLRLEADLLNAVNERLRQLGREPVDAERAMGAHRELEASQRAAFTRKDYRARVEDAARHIAGLGPVRTLGAGKGGTTTQGTPSAGVPHSVPEGDLTDELRQRLNQPELLDTVHAGVRIRDRGFTDGERAGFVLRHPEVDPGLAAALGRPGAGRDLAHAVLPKQADKSELSRKLAAALGRPEFADAINTPSMGHALAKAVGHPQLGHKLVEALRRRTRFKPEVILHPGYATGDMFGIAAALMADSRLHVVVYTNIPRRERQDKGPSIAAFYRDSGIDPQRIHLARIAPGEPDQSAAVDRALREIYGRELSADERRSLVSPVSAGTNWVANNFSLHVRHQVRSHWKLDDAGFSMEQRANLKDWLGRRGIEPSSDRDTIVLWSRFSGKKGDVHVEHDTSYEGVRQILGRLRTHVAENGGRGPLVVIAGDAYADPRHKGKYGQIADTFRQDGLEVHDLTHFWDTDAAGKAALKSWGGDSRIGQMKLYEYLRRASASVRHLGYRSGNLEALALSGHTVRYMEEPNSTGGDRMAKWHAAENSLLSVAAPGRTDRGQSLAPGYERLIVSTAPTRSGKFLVEKMAALRARGVRNMHDALHPDWVFGADKGLEKPSEVNSKFAKGFAAEDLDRITGYLTGTQPVPRTQNTQVAADAPVVTQRTRQANGARGNAPGRTRGGRTREPETVNERTSQHITPSTSRHSARPSRNTRGGGPRNAVASTQESTSARLGAASGVSDLVRPHEGLRSAYEWLDEVNAYRAQGGEFLTNCVLTAIAVDMSLREGAVHQASPAAPGGVRHPEGEDSGLHNYLENYLDRAPDAVHGVAEVVEAMSAAPVGARGMVVIERTRGEIDHVVNVTHDHNGVVFLDGQSGFPVREPAGVVSFLPTTEGIPGHPLRRDGGTGPTTSVRGSERTLGSARLATIPELNETPGAVQEPDGPKVRPVTIDVDLGERRPPRLDRGLPPAPVTTGPVHFSDGTRLPVHMTGGVASLLTALPKDVARRSFAFGQSNPELRGIDQVVDELGKQLDRSAGTRPALPKGSRAQENPVVLDQVRRALRDDPQRFFGDGTTFTYTAADGETRTLRATARPYGNWERFTFGYANPVKNDTMRRSTTTGGQVKTNGTSFGLAPTAPMGPLRAFVSPWARLHLQVNFGKQVRYSQQRQVMNQTESRAADASHLHVDDVWYEFSVRDRRGHPVDLNGKPVTEDDTARSAAGFGFAVRDGLTVRIAHSMTSSEPFTGALPQRMTLGPESRYRMVSTEAFGPVGHIHDWALEQAGVEPDSTAAAQIGQFFSTDDFHGMARVLNSGPVVTPPLLGGKHGTDPLGVFSVRVESGEAILISETKAAELRDIVQSTTRDERQVGKSRSVDVGAVLGPAFQLFGLDNGVFNLRVQAGPSARYTASRNHGTVSGGTTAVKIAGQAKNTETGLYLVQKTVTVTAPPNTKAARPAAKHDEAGRPGKLRKNSPQSSSEPPRSKTFDTFAIERMTRTEARRLAGLGEAAGETAQEPVATPYLTEDNPATLGMSRVEEFTFADGHVSRVVDGKTVTFAEHFADAVLKEVGKVYPDLVAPLHELNPKSPRWRGTDHFKTVLNNTLEILNQLSHHSLATNVETMMTTGLRIDLVESAIASRGHRYVWVDAKLTGRRYEGEQQDLRVRFSAPGSEVVGGRRSGARGGQVGVEGIISLRDTQTDDIGWPQQVGAVSAGVRIGGRRDSESGYGMAASNEHLSYSTGGSYLYSYDLRLEAKRGGYARPRRWMRGLMFMNVLGTQPFVFDEPESTLLAPPTGAKDAPGLGRVLLSIPVEHSPAAAPAAGTSPAPGTQRTAQPPQAMSREEALDLALGRGKALEDAASRDTSVLSLHPHQTISVTSDKLLATALERVLEEASAKSWVVTRKGAPVHDAAAQLTDSRSLRANFDQSSTAMGWRAPELWAAAPYLNRSTWLAHRTTVLPGLTALTKAVMVNTDSVVGGTTQAAGRSARTSTLFFGGQLGYRRSQEVGTGVTGNYALVLSPYRLDLSESTTVQRSAVSEITRRDSGRHVLVSAAVQHEIAVASDRIGAWAYGSRHVPAALAGAAGTRIVIPEGWLGHIPEKSAYRLGILDDAFGDVPLYRQRTWSPFPWLRGAFGSWPLNSLNTAAALRRFEEQLTPLGLTTQDREQLRRLVSGRVMRAIGKEMAGTGASVPARIGRWGSEWARTWVGHRQVRLRARLVPVRSTGDNFGGLGHSVELEEARQAVESVQRAHGRSSGKTIGVAVSQGAHTAESVVPMAGPSYTQTGSSIQATAHTQSDGTVDITTVAISQAHGEYATQYELELDLEITDSEPEAPAPAELHGVDRDTGSAGRRLRTWTGRRRHTISVREDVGRVIEHLPLSLMRPDPQVIDGEADPLAPPLLEQRAEPHRTALPKAFGAGGWHDVVHRGPGAPTKPFEMPEQGFAVRGIIGLEGLHAANTLALGAAYDTSLSVPTHGPLNADLLARAQDTPLTRAGTGAAQSLEDGTSNGALSAFYERTLTPDGYQVAGLTERDFFGGADGSLTLYSKPDFSGARLLTVTDGAKFERAHRGSHGAGASADRVGSAEQVLHAGPTASSPAVGTNQIGSGSGAQGLDSAASGQYSEQLASVNIKPDKARTFLFAIPTKWLSVAHVEHHLKDSAPVRLARSIFGNLQRVPQAVETDATVVAWVRADVARQLGLVDDINFPAEVSDSWDAVAQAEGEWIAADEAYWALRRGDAAKRQTELAAADRVLTDLAGGDPLSAPSVEEALAALHALKRDEAETAHDGRPDLRDERIEQARTQVERARQIETSRAARDIAQQRFDEVKADLAVLRAHADRLSTEYARVREAADRLTRWHQLNATPQGRAQLEGTPPPPKAIFAAPESPELNSRRPKAAATAQSSESEASRATAAETDALRADTPEAESSGTRTPAVGISGPQAPLAREKTVRRAHADAPWQRAGASGPVRRFDAAADHRSLTVTEPDGQIRVYDLYRPEGDGNGFYAAVLAARGGRPGNPASLAGQVAQSPHVPAGLGLDPQAVFHIREVVGPLEVAFQDAPRLREQIREDIAANGGRLPEALRSRLTLEQRRSLVRLNLRTARGWNTETADTAARLTARILRVDLTVVQEDGAHRSYSGAVDDTSGSRGQVTVYQRGGAYLAAVPRPVPATDAKTSPAERLDAMAEFVGAAQALAETFARRSAIRERLQGAGSSADVRSAAAQEDALDTALSRFDTAERRLVELGLGDLSGRDDPQLPRELRQLPPQEFRTLMRRAGELLGTPSVVFGAEPTVQAARGTHRLAQIAVAAELAGNAEEAARALAADLSEQLGIHSGKLPGGAVTVGNRNLTAEFREASQDLEDTLQRDLASLRRLVELRIQEANTASNMSVVRRISGWLGMNSRPAGPRFDPAVEIEELRQEIAARPAETLREQKRVLAHLLEDIERGLGNDYRGQLLSASELSAYQEDRARIRRRLARLIVEPTGHRGHHDVLDASVGKHPEFGAKRQDVKVDTYSDLVRGAMGWIGAKPNRHREKELALRVEDEGHVEPVLDILLTRIHSHVRGLPNGHQMLAEMESGVSHVDGRELGSYLTHFRKQNLSEDLAHLATQVWDRGGMAGVLRDPAGFGFRDKMMVLHDLMEYFREYRHYPTTHGTGLLPDARPEDQQSTTIVDDDGRRVFSSSDRGQNTLRDGTTHASTRDEDAPSTLLARALRVPVWAGQSFTALRIFKLAQWAGASRHEIAAVAWGIFAFWRLHYDHRERLAYHTLHETLDIAQNFGVPYSLNDRAAGLSEVGVERALTMMEAKAADFAALSEQVDKAVGVLSRSKVPASMDDVLDELRAAAQRLSTSAEELERGMDPVRSRAGERLTESDARAMIELLDHERTGLEAWKLVERHIRVVVSGLEGGSRDHGLDPQAEGWEPGREITVVAQRYGLQEREQELPFTVPSSGNGKGAEVFRPFSRTYLHTSRSYGYEVGTAGTVLLPDGTALSGRWTRFGDDFLHDQGYVLRGDNGWVGRVANWRELRAALPTRAAQFTLTADEARMYFLPADGTGRAVVLPLTEEHTGVTPTGTARPEATRDDAPATVAHVEEIDLLDPERFRVHTTDPAASGLRSLSRVADLDRLLNEYRQTDEHDHALRADILDQLADRARTYAATTKNDFRRQAVQRLAEQAGTRAITYRRQGQPQKEPQSDPAPVDTVESTTPAGPLGYRERIALAKRVWEGPVTEEVARLERMLLEAGPGARSLVLGAVPDEPVWAMNVMGEIRWLEQATAHITRPPRTARGPVVSIDLDPRARLIKPDPRLLAAGAGREAARFCELVVGGDLKHVV